MSPEILQIIIVASLLFVGVIIAFKPATRTDEETRERLNDIKRGIRRPPKEKRKSFFAKPENVSSKESLMKGLAEAINDFIKPPSRTRPLSKNDLEIRKLLSIANINISMATFFFLRVAMGAIMSVSVFVVATFFFRDAFSDTQILIATLSAFLGGTLLPKTMLSSHAKNRRIQIVSSMTDTIDLIAISVEAGLGYDAAVMSIYQKNKSPAMQELKRTIDDINFGMSRRDAYRSLSARCDTDEMTLFANSMSQADVMGIPIVNVLKAQADALRVARRRKAEMQVQKAPIKMLIPLVAFIFPTLLVVLLGPAVINIMRYLQ